MTHSRPTAASASSRLLPTVLAGLLVASGFATTIAAARVDAVTVYPDRATIERISEHRVGPGIDRIRIADLPVGLDRDSVRVRAEGPDGLRIGALDFEIVRGEQRVLPEARALAERIEQLEAERSAVADRIAARALQLSLLQRVAAPTGEVAPPPGELLAELERLGELADRVYSEQRELRMQQDDLGETIERLRRELADLGGEQRDVLALTIAVDAPGAGTARFEIGYTVGGANWRPVYEWRLDTTAATLRLVQSAELRQSTGEDWANASVAFSLARPASGGQLPTLGPWWIDVIAARPELQRRQFAEAPQALSAMEAAGASADVLAAELQTTGLTQRYALPGRIDVPSDNRPRRFRLDEHVLDADLTARAVPQRRDAAWTFVATDWIGEAALPPGPVQLIQDGASMGRTNFSGAAPGGRIEASFGIDDRIEIDVELVRQDRRTEGLLNKTVRELREHRWTVSNRHQRRITLSLLGQMPVARDERIDVELTDRSTAPDRRDVDDQPGRMAWDLELDPGETREITFGISVAWPAELDGVTGW